MYNNEIVILLDNIIEDFYNSVILKNKEIPKMLNDQNFVKFQQQINKILIDYTDLIDTSSISKIVINQDNIKTIIELIKRYLSYYLFLYIGFFYDKKRETYINNVIEFGKNQSSFKYKVSNFFNSESNSNIIKFFNLSKNITIIIAADQKQLEVLIKKQEFMDVVKFLNEFGMDYVSTNFKLENLDGNKNTQSHNIIKTIIINELYIKTEKKDVFEILDAAEKEKGEYTFINIMVPKENFIDFSMIENVLSKKDIENGLAYDIYDLIMDDNTITKDDLTNDEKILKLINNNVFVPVVDDFLLYHKDTEKYEKVSLDISKSKKKEDTKIRYIVSKVDKVSEYHSPNTLNNDILKKETEKLFYVPLIDRKAIIINDIEELKIIQKLLNQGKKIIDSNEYYNDLMNLRMYPYINFKEFKTDGFSLPLTDTIDVIRYSTFDSNKSSKSIEINNLQLRIGSSKQIADIVGFIIPTNKTPLECITTNRITNVKDLQFKTSSGIKTINNGYQNTLKFINKLYINNNDKQKHTSIYWKFNLDTDKVIMKKYDQVTKMNNTEQMKLIVSKMYDDLTQSMYNAIFKLIDNKSKISKHEFNNIVKSFEKKLFEFPKNSDMYNKLLHIITYDKYLETKNEYDKNEDIFYGLGNNVIKLPNAPLKVSGKTEIIYTKDITIKKDVNKLHDANKTIAICQHNITWDQLSAIRKKNPNVFSQMLFDFIYKYVIENNENDYVCKSCGTQVNIKIFVRDGNFTDDGHFVSFSSPLEVPLEDIPEYEKYKLSIRNIDKIIERLSSVCNIAYFIGNSTTVKWRRRTVIKDTIDLIGIHNNNLKQIYKNRNENQIKKYGISKDLTNLFVFELDNSIFIYSSKDKDYYKHIKQNNVLVYVLFLSILELTDGQILAMSNDRTCNYYWFDKYTHVLFDDLKLIINNKGDIEPIKKYPVLCYVLYFMSCMITKYSMWYYEKDDGDKKKKFDPVIQKIIINTFIDLINSILELHDPKSQNRMYSTITMKFFNKLNTLFSNTDIINKLNELEKKKIVTIDGKKKYMVTKIKSIRLADIYEIGTYHGIHEYQSCVNSKFFANQRKFKKDKQYNITNITNCLNGKFHIWIYSNKTLKCSICNATTDNIKLNLKDSESANTNNHYMLLRKISERYCISGQLHKFIIESSINCNICTKCKFTNNNTLTNIQLDELNENIIKMKNNDDQKLQNTINNNDSVKLSKQQKYDDFILNLKSEYGKSKSHKDDHNGFIHKFITLLESIIGKNININNENIYLIHDTYIIDHDHNGYSITKPITIINDDNKIQFKKNHPFFKKDVVFYTNYKIGKIDVFYDASTYLLLGFKESSKEYQISKNLNKYIKINYSILNRIQMMGHTSKFINISDLKSDINKYYSEKSSQNIIIEIASKIGRNRIINLKKSITDIQRFLYKIKHKIDQITNDEVKEHDPEKIFLANYYKKLEKIKLKDKDNKNKVFEGWKNIYNIFFQNLQNKTINLSIDDKYISYDDFNSHDYHGNLILFYIVRELNKLLEYNNDKFTQSNTAYFAINALNYLFNIFNQEHNYTNFELQRFDYILNSYTYIHDVEESGHGLGGNVEGFYGEQADNNDVDIVDELATEQQDINNEENDALDIEGEIDYEIDYAAD
jgi:hypothetical protein